jgi:hypothetical protein
MNLEEATEELLDLVYDPPIFHSDPYAQRKSVETSIADILNDIEPEHLECGLIESLREDKNRLLGRILDLNARLKELEGE